MHGTQRKALAIDSRVPVKKWALLHVGLPAKSGVGGGIVAVVPGKGAIAVFGPTG